MTFASTCVPVTPYLANCSAISLTSFAGIPPITLLAVRSFAIPIKLLWLFLINPASENKVLRFWSGNNIPLAAANAPALTKFLAWVSALKIVFDICAIPFGARIAYW